MAEFTHTDVRNIAFSRGQAGETNIVVTTAEQPDAPVTDLVATRDELQAALNDGAADITVAARIQITPATSVNVPRKNATVLRALPGAGLFGTGEDFRILRSEGAGGGQLKIVGLTINGGAKLRPGEASGDQAANFYLNGFDFLELEGVTTEDSRRTGFHVRNTRKLRVSKCTGNRLPRDFLWSNGSRFVLVEDCVVTHSGDDGLGCHLDAGDSGTGRTIIFRRNKCYGTLGIKLLGGAPGGSIMIEDNDITAAGFYGIRFGIDPTTGEGTATATIENIVARNNTINDVQVTNPCHPGQRQGVHLFFYAPNQRVNNIVYMGNTLVRSPNNGKRVRDVYSTWSSEGAYTKTGFDPEWRLDLGNEAIRSVCLNPGSITVDGNSIVGFGR